MLLGFYSSQDKNYRKYQLYLSFEIFPPLTNFWSSRKEVTFIFAKLNSNFNFKKSLNWSWESCSIRPLKNNPLDTRNISLTSTSTSTPTSTSTITLNITSSLNHLQGKFPFLLSLHDNFYPSLIVYFLGDT